MVKYIILLSFFFISGCEKVIEEIKIEAIPTMGLDLSESSVSCETGGITLKSYIDSNSNYSLDSFESVKKVVEVCNGRDGTNGTNGSDGISPTIETASSFQCPAGGVVINGTAVCNGQDGSMGLQGEQGVSGVQGPQGVPGPVGPNGQPGPAGQTGPQGPIGPQGPSGSVGNVTPVQLCPGDTGTFKEYGIFIGTSLYAVYHSPTATFLALLTPGSYVTTNGANCHFTYTNTGSTGTLTNGSGTTTVNLTNPNNGGTGQSSMVYTNTVARQNGNNNAYVTLEFENQGSSAVTKFKVTIGGLDSSQIQSGSSVLSHTGAVQSFNTNSVTFTISSPGIAVGAVVRVKVLLSSLNSSQNLVFTTQIL